MVEGREMGWLVWSKVFLSVTRALGMSVKVWVVDAGGDLRMSAVVLVVAAMVVLLVG